MGVRRKIATGPGQFHDAELIEVQQAQEQWNQYLLGDGTIVKLKVVVTEIWRLDGEYDNDGNPRYVIKSGNILVVNAPDDLRRQPQ